MCVPVLFVGEGRDGAAPGGLPEMRDSANLLASMNARRLAIHSRLSASVSTGNFSITATS